MHISNIRQKVIEVYSKPGWRDKVLHMSEEQVFAIFKSLQERGMIPDHILKQHNKPKVKYIAYDHNGIFKNFSVMMDE